VRGVGWSVSLATMSASPQRHPSAPSGARLPRVAAVERACRLIERTDEPPSLAALAASAGLSLWHFHRVFKGATGVTPKEYVSAHRAKRARAALEGGRSVTDAIYEAGFGSSGRFYEASDRMLGMTPTQYRAGGATTEIRFALGGCSLGLTLVAASEPRRGRPELRHDGRARRRLRRDPAARSRPSFRCARHRLPASGLGGVARNSSRNDSHLR
jgi:AraC-like DNA-binding protein